MLANHEQNYISERGEAFVTSKYQVWKTKVRYYANFNDRNIEYAITDPQENHLGTETPYVQWNIPAKADDRHFT